MYPSAEPAPTSTPAPISPVQPTKKTNPMPKIIILILTIILSAGISGATVWYFMNQQNTNDKKALTSQITTKDAAIAELQEISGTATTTPTATETTTTTAPNYLESLKTFCAEDGKYTVSNYYFAAVTNGLYGGCNVASAGSAVGGSYKITKIVDNAWTLIINTQASSKEYLEQNMIPLNVVISPNAYNLIN